MANSFSISRSRISLSSDPESRLEIRAYTDSDEEASSILRSIKRLGDDPSIRRYEVTPATSWRAQRSTSPITWTVSAVRI